MQISYDRVAKLPPVLCADQLIVLPAMLLRLQFGLARTTSLDLSLSGCGDSNGRRELQQLARRKPDDDVSRRSYLH